MVFVPTYHERNLRNISYLASNTKKAALLFYYDVVKDGIDILIYETIRTVEKQKQYVREGKSQTMKSYHLVGQALDWVLIDRNKDALWNAYSTKNGKKVIELAEKRGFESGAKWKGFIDAPHLQYKYKGYGTDKILNNKDIKFLIYPGILFRIGTTGKYVEQIQNKLELNVDGIFGQNTEVAVKKFQLRENLTADGIVGKETWNRLFK